MSDVIIAIIGSGAFTAIVTAIVNYLIHNKESNELLNNGVKCLLGIQIRNQCENALKRGNISLEELEQIQEMNSTYKSLSGNGYVKVLMGKIENLPIIDE